MGIVKICALFTNKTIYRMLCFVKLISKDVERFWNGLIHELAIARKLIKLVKLILLLPNKSDVEKISS